MQKAATTTKSCASALTLALLATLLALAPQRSSQAQQASAETGSPAPVFVRAANSESSPITVGALQHDGSTTETLSLYLPVVAGDSDKDAVAIVEYRKSGTAEWRQALDLFKHNKTEVAPFAGMIFGLTPDTAYDVRVTVRDPDGVNGAAQQTKTMRTKKVPPIVAATGSNTVKVSAAKQLQAALDSAKAGQVILLAPGTYDADFRIHQRNGTAAAPITVRGAEDFASVVDGHIRISDSNYIHVEGLHITNANVGVEIIDWEKGGDGTRGNVIRGNFIDKVVLGINAKSNGWSGPGHDDLYIVDNVLEGKNKFGDVSNATWDDEGIVVVGRDVEVAWNTLSGFGDSLGLTHTDSTWSVDIHHNHVIYGGDDGVELDFGVRNVAARDNLFSNTGDGVSFQFIQDGPGYAFRNVIYNVLGDSRGPFKIKPEAQCNSGVFILNNTSVNNGRGWINFSGCGSDIHIFNNIFTGDRTEQDVIRLDSSPWKNLYWDHNAYIYDGYFQFADGFYTSFGAFKGAGKRGANDLVILKDPVFRSAELIGQQKGLGGWRDASAMDFRLAAGSAAIGAGKVLPTIADGVAGAGPDIGAVQSGDPAKGKFGARIAPDRLKAIARPNPIAGPPPVAPPPQAKAKGADAAPAAQARAAPPEPPARHPTPKRRAGTPAPEDSPSLPNAIDRLAAGQWYEVPGTRMESVIPKAYYGGALRSVMGPAAIMSAWGGGAFDTRRNRLIIWGGGHNDYAGNELYVFDVDTLRWTRLTDATDPPEKNADSGSTPASRHTYGNIAYLPNDDMFFAHGGSVYQSGSATDTVWLFDFGSATWERRSGPGGGNSGGHSGITDVDPATGTVLQVNGNDLDRYDLQADAWTNVNSGDVNGYHKSGAFDSKRNQFLVIGGGASNGNYVIDVDSGRKRRIEIEGATEFLESDYPGFVYVAANDKFYGWNGKSDIVELTPETWKLRKLPVAAGSATPTAASQWGTFGRFRYVPSKNAFIAVNAIDQNVFIYKLGANPK